jgi:hypothetical protein
MTPGTAGIRVRAMRPSRVAGFIGVVIVVAFVTGNAGCGLRRARVLAPEGAPAVRGVVERAAAPVSGEWVKLYDDQTGALTDSSLTGGGGAYGFGPVPAGEWMVKASSAAPGDLGYVRYIFQGPVSSLEVPPLDLYAFGFDLLQPADSATVPRPNIFAPLHFAWSPYGAPYRWASARITDTLGVTVWSSAMIPATAADWNGVGNDGAYAGQPVSPGRYLWRVRLHLPNSVHAASRQRQIVISP